LSQIIDTFRFSSVTPDVQFSDVLIILSIVVYPRRFPYNEKASLTDKITEFAILPYPLITGGFVPVIRKILDYQWIWLFYWGYYGV
jgi:hypothetical protein